MSSVHVCRFSLILGTVLVNPHISLTILSRHGNHFTDGSKESSLRTLRDLLSGGCVDVDASSPAEDVNNFTI
jgi:hypothetical protein